MRILAPMSAQAKAPVAAPRGGADALRVRRNGVRGEAGRLRPGRRMSPPLSGRAQDARSHTIFRVRTTEALSTATDTGPIACQSVHGALTHKS